MIALVVHLTVKPGSEKRAKEFITALEENTRREPGCRLYIGHQSTEDPRDFCFYEQYVDQAALDAHGASAHFQKYAKEGLYTITEKRSRHLFTVVNP